MLIRFDYADTLGLPRPLRFVSPARAIVAHRLDEVRSAMRAVDEATRAGFYAAGYMSYEAAQAFDEALTTKPAASQLPLVWFGLFREPTSDPEAISDPEPTSDSTSREPVTRPHAPMAWQPDVTHDRYAEGVAAVKSAIARGDTYQVNYTFRMRADLQGDACDLYRRVRDAQRAPYSAWLDLGRWRILSWSPELFFARRGTRIRTRPMKGTMARGRWIDEDRAQAARLAASDKDRAENVMIVDLARNDVGRIAEVGSVAATSLYDIERYPSVFQMVSTVEGTLREKTSLDDVFAALFPAGSITGAPKSSSMRLIAEVEDSPRGVYCGAIGFVTPAGDAIFNVAIRTAIVDMDTRQAEYGVGGGITWDSTTEGEYAEALSKAAGLSLSSPEFELLETMRLDRGEYIRRHRHLRRLAESAAYFDVPFDATRIDATLDEHAQEHEETSYRVRLLLSRSGEVRIESTPLPQPALQRSDDMTRTQSWPRVALARTPISRQDRFLFHKTTNRAVFDAHRAEHPDAFDVLLWNEARELTEFTIGNIVIELDGRRVTPPRTCGLLAGTFRAELLDTGIITERIVTLDDLASATRLWLINSVREWVEVALT